MQIKDRVYGEVEISEPVLLEIINSPTLQRLKEINQAGYFEPHFSGTAHSRFEHSIGVYLLLKMYGALLEEQIAGLIHDVSHSAFSHCIDYVLDAGSEKEHNHQDNVFDEFVRKSEIPGILKKYGLDLEYILDDKNFPLKEKDLPDLCADRIDYSLRTATSFKEIENGKYLLIIF
ncbi:HD domain-containing protein [Candidatus Berkelbacteria bacterium]|nr:HD domain-containing protein [Candidatus Berkelbacteria bacterium]